MPGDVAHPGPMMPPMTDTMADTTTTGAEANTASVDTTAAGGKVTFSAEQQAALDEIIAKRTARAAADARTQYEADLNLIAEREQMDAAARAQAEKADAERVAAEKVTAAEKRAMRSDARAELIALGVPKASADTALRLVDLDSIESPDDADAIAAACAAAVAAVPGLIPTAPAGGPSGGEFTPEGGGKVWTKDEVAALTPTEYATHRAEIMKQMQTIGIK